MFTKNRELWYALLAVILVTGGYLAFAGIAGALPPASHLFGHGIGILGFVLMLMTETMYTLRKRAKSARWGRASSWLKFHIFTGLVGSYMVLLHPAMRFRGIAAAVTLLTVVVVVSGVIGRYLFTRVPRTLAAPVVAVPIAVAPAATPPDGGLPLRARALAPVAAEQAGVPAFPGDLDVPRARKGMAAWRAIHVPLTLVLFIVAIAHIVGAVYYATLLH